MEEAEAMYTEAAAQGHSGAGCNLGFLLQGMQDMDGAEAAYRAAIAADPGCTEAYSNLGVLLEFNAKQIERNGGDEKLAVTAALYDECAVLWGFHHGADSRFTEGARASAMRIRKELA